MNFIETLKENEWVINGKVYDITNFIKYHPGGQLILNINRRRDCTELFETYHLMSKKQDYIYKSLEKFYVRDCNENETNQCYDWNDPLYQEMKNYLRNSIQNYFDENGIKSIKANNTYLFMYGLLIISFLISCYYFINGYWLSVILMALCGWSLSAEILHSGTHYAIFERPKWNLLISDLFGWCMYASSLWYHEHTISHHSFTNIEGKDIDLDYHSPIFYHDVESDRNRYIQNWELKYIFASILGSLGQTLVFLKILWQSRFSKVKQRGKRFQRWFSIISSTMRHRELTTEIQMLLLLVFFPFILMYNLGIIKGLAFYILYRCILGIIYKIETQGTHYNEDALLRNKNMKQTRNFIVHQILTSVNYNDDSYLHGFLTGGINNHGLHHLIPNVHPCHYPKLSFIFRTFCKKYNIDCVFSDGLFAAFKDHIKYIAKVNNNAIRIKKRVHINISKQMKFE